MQQNPNPVAYLPKPPTPQTMRDFFAEFADHQFGIELGPDNWWKVAPDHPIAVILLKQIIQQWCDHRSCNIQPQRNQFGRFETHIIKVSPIDGSKRDICHYTADTEGESAFRAILRYEDLQKGTTLEPAEQEGAANAQPNPSLNGNHKPSTS